MVNKEELLTACLARTDERIFEIVHAIEQAQDAIVNDTKSSAGDKYETSREMVQQDLNRFQEQLYQAKKDRSILEQLTAVERDTAGVGAVVVTEKITYFIAISLGKLAIDNDVLMVVSPSSPIGKSLVGKQIGTLINFNGVDQRVINVY